MARIDGKGQGGVRVQARVKAGACEGSDPPPTEKQLVSIQEKEQWQIKLVAREAAEDNQPTRFEAPRVPEIHRRQTANTNPSAQSLIQVPDKSAEAENC